MNHWTNKALVYSFELKLLKVNREAKRYWIECVCVCLRSSLVPTCYSWRPTRDISAYSDVPDRSGTSPCPREVTCVSWSLHPDRSRTIKISKVPKRSKNVRIYTPVCCISHTLHQMAEKLNKMYQRIHTILPSATKPLTPPHWDIPRVTPSNRDTLAPLWLAEGMSQRGQIVIFWETLILIG